MGKAYTEQERMRIRTQLLEAGLELYHDQGVRKISIRALTKRAGIAQGGFYNFFPDKDTLVVEIIHYRTRQKLELFEKTFDQSLADPAAFVSESIFRIFWNLKCKADQKQMYADVLHFCLKQTNSECEKLYAVFHSTLQKLTAYWKDNGLSVTVDARGIINVIKGTLALYASVDQLDQTYFESLLKTFIDENCKKYIRRNQTGEKEYADDQKL